MNMLGAFDDTIRLAEERGVTDLPGSSLGLAHLRSMRSRIAPGFSDAKLGRWLGWAQCALVASGLATLDDMKAINMARADDMPDTSEHPYSLRPDLQKIAAGGKIAPQWDAARDRLCVPQPDTAALVAALRFYSDPASYDERYTYCSDGCCSSPNGSLVENDKGALARAALDAQPATDTAALVEALRGLLRRYVDLATSGDAGFWDCEAEPEVIAARAALDAHPQPDTSALVDAAHGLSFGEDWNNGTAARWHRQSLLVAIGKIMGERASPQAKRAALGAGAK